MQMDKSLDKIKARIIDTGNGCFISDCFSSGGYDYNYHYSKLSNLLFDGEIPIQSYKKNWLFIPKYPSKIQREVGGEKINHRWELKDKSLADKFLEVVPNNYDGEDYDKYFDEDGCFEFPSLYEKKYDTVPKSLEDVEIEWESVLNVSDFKKPPEICFSGVHQVGWGERKYEVTNASVNHYVFDEMIVPSVLIHKQPCYFTSKQVYDITREWVRSHIDPKVAKITSDYDFCFEVVKLIPLFGPEKITYHNLFARTKKERQKLRTSTVEFRNKTTIFEMTSEEKRYNGYTPIPKMVADSEEKLQAKMQEWLDSLISEINRPLVECPYCKGLGIVELQEKVNPSWK